MNSFLLSVFTLLLLNVSCGKFNEPPDIRSYEYFNATLKAGMDSNAIKFTFNKYDFDKGSGIHIYVYKLRDSSEVWIGYTDHILYARHVDANGQLLHTII